MFDHVTIRATDRAASERFYELALGTLGIKRSDADDYVAWDEFVLVAAEDEHPATRGLHLGFAARSRADVDRFWEAGTTAGHRSDGQPGLRTQYREDYYGAFLLDPDGNSIEAVHHGALRRGGSAGTIDHLWIRVANAETSRRFYSLVAPHAGYAPRSGEPVGFVGAGGSLSLVGGSPARPLTAHLHLAFPAPETEAVDAFHRTAIEAGYRDNGAPGGRPEYGGGYYAAFVLDPDGTNVELVHHAAR